MDLDDQAALSLADEYLPPTGMVDGRPGKPRSHRAFLVPCGSIPEDEHSQAAQAAPAAVRFAGHPGPRTRSYQGPDGKEILKLVGTGGQVVCPPSLHPSGERRAWAGPGGRPGEPAAIDYPTLRAAVEELARACGWRPRERSNARPAGASRRAEVVRPPAPEIGVDQWALDTVLDRLSGWGPCGDGYSALCPAHADRKPSLSVGETDRGDVLLHCHAGCETEAVLAAVGLNFTHLYTSEYARRFGRRRDGRAAPPAPGHSSAGGGDADHEAYDKILAAARVEYHEAFMPLCRATGLCVRACVDFGLGVSGGRFVFPERDDRLRPVGVVYRTVGGEKRCHPGGTRGLTLPVVDRGFGGKVYVTEGATDALALHSLKVRAAGRPSAAPPAPAFGWLAAYLTRHAGQGVVVVGDNDPRDEGGRRVRRDAARDLAGRLAGVLPGGIPVSWAVPAKGYKDLREQITANAWGNGLRLREVTR